VAGKKNKEEGNCPLKVDSMVFGRVKAKKCGFEIRIEGEQAASFRPHKEGSLQDAWAKATHRGTPGGLEKGKETERRPGKKEAGIWGG